MSRKTKIYDDDDGRTIADMTDVSGPSLFVPKSVPEKRAAMPREQKKDRPWEKSGYSKKERLMVVLGVMKGTLLIALCYILAFGLLVALLLLLS